MFCNIVDSKTDVTEMLDYMLADVFVGREGHRHVILPARPG